jgi:hypothetical protein
VLCTARTLEPAMSLLDSLEQHLDLSFLDADGDGEIMDDIADKGKSLLGGLFGGGDKKA